MKEIIKSGDERALDASLRDLVIKSYQTGDLNQYLDFLKSSGFGLADGLRPYIKHLKRDGWTDRNGNKHSYQAASIRIKLDAAKRLGDYVIDKYPDAFSPATQLQWEKEKKKAKAPKSVKGVDSDQCLPWPDVQELIARTQDPRISLIIAFLAQTACRIGEALSIRLDDMARNGTHYRVIVHGKGDKDRKVSVEIPLVEKIVSTFGSTTWLFEHSGKPYNANSVTTRIKEAGRGVLGKDISAHTLRHSWTTEQLRRGRSLDEVSKYLGHASMSITADIYSHVSLDSAEAMLPLSSDGAPKDRG